MNERLIKLLVAMATDGRVLADYQSDPEATTARFGLNERDMKQLVESLRDQASSRVSVLTAVTIGNPVTH